MPAQAPMTAPTTLATSKGRVSFQSMFFFRISTMVAITAPMRQVEPARCIGLVGREAESEQDRQNDGHSPSRQNAQPAGKNTNQDNRRDVRSNVIEMSRNGIGRRGDCHRAAVFGSAICADASGRRLWRHLGEFFGDVRSKRRGGGDVPVGGDHVTLPALGKAAPIE